MFLDDSMIDWRRLSVFHGASTFGSSVPSHTHAIAITDSDTPSSGTVPLYWDPDGVAGARLVADLDGGYASENVGSTSLVLTGIDDGTPNLEEISTFGDVGFKMNTDGNSVSKKIIVPRNWDLTQDLGFKVYWTSGSATSADTIDWIVVYKKVTEDAAITAPATALTTAIAQDTVGANTAWLMKVTSEGVLDGATLTSTSRILFINVEMDTHAVGLSEDIYFLGLEVLYTPRMTAGRAMQHVPTA